MRLRQFLTDLSDLTREALRWLVVHQCDACGSRLIGPWSRARRLGWEAHSAWPSEDGCVLCPECQEPSEVKPW